MEFLCGRWGEGGGGRGGGGGEEAIDAVRLMETSSTGADWRFSPVAECINFFSDFVIN